MTTDRIEINPQVMMGKPVIKGTRITVELILRKLSDGSSEDDLLDAYPRLTREDIRAAVAYAADALGNGQSATHPQQPRANRRNELQRLKAARFPAEGKEQRVAAALRALDKFRWNLPLSPEELRWIAEDVDIEDL